MKLIENISNDKSVLSYFPGIQDENINWDLKNPAIFHKFYLTSNDYQYVILPKFNNISSGEYKYIFVKLDAIKYQIFINSLDGRRAGYQIIAFDYLSCKTKDINNNENYFFNQQVGSIYYSSPRYTWSEQKISLNLDKPILLLLKISAVNNDATTSNQSEVRLCFSNPPIKFDYSSHWVRNWQNKVNGTSWDFTGKINNLLDLKKTSRNYKLEYNKVKYWKNGALAYVLPCNEKLNSYENMKKYFKNIHESDYKYIENIRIDGNILENDSQFIVHMKFYLQNTNETNYNFQMNYRGQFAISIKDKNDQVYYINYNNSYDWINLRTGINQVEIFYNSYNESSIPYFDINISPLQLLLKNECDINQYISLDKIFADVSNQSITTGYINFNQTNSFEIRCDDINKFFTISFWLKVKSIPEKKEISIITSNELSVKFLKEKIIDNETNEILSTENILQIKHLISNKLFNIKLQINQWNHICIVMSQSVFSCYINFFENYFSIINYSGTYDNLYKIGHGNFYTDDIDPSFDLYNIIIFNEAKKQIQVNKLFLNEKRPLD